MNISKRMIPNNGSPGNCIIWINNVWSYKKENLKVLKLLIDLNTIKKGCVFFTKFFFLANHLENSKFVIPRFHTLKLRKSDSKNQYSMHPDINLPWSKHRNINVLKFNINWTLLRFLYVWAIAILTTMSFCKINFYDPKYQSSASKTTNKKPLIFI